FRLWFMTFFGELRIQPGAHDTTHPAPHASGTDHDPSQDPGHGAHDDHGHGHGGVHESPWVMLAPLVVLAILSGIGGYVGIGSDVGIGNRFEHFLAPVMATAQEGAKVSAPEEGGSSEMLLTGLSVLAAACGFFLAWLLYYNRRDLPNKIADRMRAVYALVSNKY